MVAVLIDTNLLIYAHDGNEPERQAQAVRILRQMELAASGHLSVQCLAEFYSVSTRRLRPPLSAMEAASQVELLCRAYPVHDLTPAIILEATRGARDHQLAYYDAQLWATARLNQIPVLFSEDFGDRRVLEGVRFVNPFAPEFILEEWT